MPTDETRRKLLQILPAVVAVSAIPAVAVTNGAKAIPINPAKRHLYIVNAGAIEIEEFCKSDLPPGPVYAISPEISLDDVIRIYELEDLDAHRA